MSPEDRATEFMDWIWENTSLNGAYIQQTREQVTAAITAAVEDENVACAVLAQDTAIPFAKDLAERTGRKRFYQQHIKAAWDQCATQIASRIRARMKS